MIQISDAGNSLVNPAVDVSNHRIEDWHKKSFSFVLSSFFSDGKKRRAIDRVSDSGSAWIRIDLELDPDPH